MIGDIGRFRRRGPLLLFAAVFAFGAASATVADAKTFKNANFKGGYGCLAVGGLDFSHLMQLAPNGKGGFSGGQMFFSAAGELCVYSLAGGSYGVDSSGAGTMTLHWTLSANGSDPDHDADCTQLFDGDFSEAFAVILDNGGKSMELMAQDDFFSGSNATGDEDFFMEGSCYKQ